MLRDEIVEQVRRVRREHAARFNNDIQAIAAAINREARESGRRVVVLQPRRAKAR